MAGFRKFSPNKSFKARTSGRATRSFKRAVNPLYGKKGMGYITNPERAIKNKIYHATTFGVSDISKMGSHKSTKRRSTQRRRKATPSKRSSKENTSLLIFGFFIVIAAILVKYWYIVLLIALIIGGIVIYVLKKKKTSESAEEESHEVPINVSIEENDIDTTANKSTYKEPDDSIERVLNDPSQHDADGNLHFKSTSNYVDDQMIGRSFERNKDLNNAILAYHSALNLSLKTEPDIAPPPNIFSRLAIIYRRQKDYQKELDILEKALFYHPNDDKFIERKKRVKELMGTKEE